MPSPNALLRYFALVIFCCFVIAGCKKDDTTTVAPPTNSDIPTDPGGTAPATVINNIVPSGSFAKAANNPSRIQLNLLGIINPSTGLPIQFTANSTVFVTEDTTLKGLKVTAAGGLTSLGADVVFVVDNSGSMSEEADSIAMKIIAFSTFLQASGLNVKVGCVGHGYNSDAHVYGAMNLTTAASLSAYLNRSTGTERTYGFGGTDSARFESAASTFGHSGGGENSIVGIYFADSLFSWRQGANRVYVLFTDEPTQPGGFAQWSTGYLATHWTPAKGTIHTVFSEDTTSYSYTDLQNERPWQLAVITGGTMKFIPSDASGLDLTTLPVTNVLSNSTLVEFISGNPNGTHNVTVTVKTTGADGKTIFQNMTY